MSGVQPQRAVPIRNPVAEAGLHFDLKARRPVRDAEYLSDRVGRAEDARFDIAPGGDEGRAMSTPVQRLVPRFLTIVAAFRRPSHRCTDRSSRATPSGDRKLCFEATTGRGPFTVSMRTTPVVETT